MAEYRQWRNENRTMLKDVVPLETPYSIKLETSSLCNARCVYCAHSLPDHGGVYQGNMTMEVFDKVLSDLEEFPDKPRLMDMYQFGEPLCNPLLAQMIKKAKSRQVVEKINFTTNALLFTKDRIDEIMESDGVDIIRISIQGLDSESYWINCGVRMDYERFLDNLSYLYKHKGRCEIRIKIADTAIKGIENGKQIFEELYNEIADTIFVEHILPVFNGVDYDGIDDGIKNDILNGREGIETSSVHIVCHRPFYILRVASNGIVSAGCCDTPRDVIYGNINDQSLYNIWNGSKHMNFLKMQLEGKRFCHPSCKDCAVANDVGSDADYLDPWAEVILERWIG